MCIGVPVQVMALQGSYALCRRADDSQVLINTLLIDPPKVGDWLLSFLDTARELLTEAHAMQILDALQGLQLAINGADPSHLFADLINREPTLPDFLKPEHNGCEQPEREE